MKRLKSIIVILLSSGLTLSFLFYAGAFRDHRNPLSVIDYFYACMENHEPFLIYSISDKKHFDYIKMRDIMGQHFLKKIKRSCHEIAGMDAARTLVKTTITYQDDSFTILLTELNKQGDSWLVNPEFLAVE